MLESSALFSSVKIRSCTIFVIVPWILQTLDICKLSGQIAHSQNPEIAVSAEELLLCYFWGWNNDIFIVTSSLCVSWRWLLFWWASLVERLFNNAECRGSNFPLWGILLWGTSHKVHFYFQLIIFAIFNHSMWGFIIFAARIFSVVHWEEEVSAVFTFAITPCSFVWKTDVVTGENTK